jgi:hypothetical protein
VSIAIRQWTPEFQERPPSGIEDRPARWPV